MRFAVVAIATAALIFLGCDQAKTGESKSEVTINEETGESVRSMVIQFNDGTLDGIQFGGVVMKAQGLDDAGNVLAFTDGKTESDITVKHSAYRILRGDNHYKDLYRYALLNFELPAAATQWKIDFSQIKNRSCTPEPAQGMVADVPNVTEIAGIGGNGYTIFGKCKFAYNLSGVVKGLKGDLVVATSDTLKQTISATGADAAFEIAVDTLKAGTPRDMTAAEIADFITKVELIGAYEGTGYYRTDAGEVTVATSPTGQTCTVTNGKKEFEGFFNRPSPQGNDGSYYNVGGEVIIRNYLTMPIVNDVSIACVDNPPEDVPPVEYTLKVDVSGLTSGTLKLRNNINLNSLDVTADGLHTFSQVITENDGYDYDVRIMAQPAGQTCTLTGDVATATADVTVMATCAPNGPPTFSISGTVAGLPLGEYVTLRLTYGALNTTEDLIVNDNPMVDPDTFQFTAGLIDGAAYSISVQTNPVSATCSVDSGGSGNVSSADITNVTISCM